MSRVLLRRITCLNSAFFRRFASFAGRLLLFLLVQPLLAAAECPEQPGVWMNEETAASHLLARRDPQLPAGRRGIRRVEKVVLLITVDRQGSVCHLRPVSGRADLRNLAVAQVREHWRYRPFFVNGKPVVAQFPVTVKFSPRQEKPPNVLSAGWRKPPPAFAMHRISPEDAVRRIAGNAAALLDARTIAGTKR